MSTNDNLTLLDQFAINAPNDLIGKELNAMRGLSWAPFKAFQTDAILRYKWAKAMIEERERQTKLEAQP